MNLKVSPQDNVTLLTSSNLTTLESKGTEYLILQSDCRHSFHLDMSQWQFYKKNSSTLLYLLL